MFDMYSNITSLHIPRNTPPKNLNSLTIYGEHPRRICTWDDMRVSK